LQEALVVVDLMRAKGGDPNSSLATKSAPKSDA
jgi:hypothetical protein